MGYAKERGKLEKLLTKIVGVEAYSEKGLAVLSDGHENYSHVIRILKNKEPDLFMDLYKNELEDIKAGKKLVKESEADEARQEHFVTYKNAIVNAMQKTISVTKETV